MRLMAEGRFERAAMPDLKVTVERTVADKDLVAVHWKVGRIVEGREPDAAATFEVRAPPWTMVRPDYVTSVTAGGRGRGRI
jgi:hypothetical protein